MQEGPYSCKLQLLRYVCTKLKAQGKPHNKAFRTIVELYQKSEFQVLLENAVIRAFLHEIIYYEV